MEEEDDDGDDNNSVCADNCGIMKMIIGAYFNEAISMPGQFSRRKDNSLKFHKHFLEKVVKLKYFLAKHLATTVHFQSEH